MTDIAIIIHFRHPSIKLCAIQFFTKCEMFCEWNWKVILADFPPYIMPRNDKNWEIYQETF